MASTCIQKVEPSSFWTFHDYLFDHQALINTATIRSESIESIAKDRPETAKKIELCIEDNDTDAEVQRDVELGRKLGVNSTPTIFVDGKKIEGAQTVAEIRLAIESARADRVNSRQQAMSSVLREQP